MSTLKPRIPPLYGGPLGSLLAAIQNRGIGERSPADLGATGFRPTQPIPPQPSYTTLPDGSQVHLPVQSEPFTGTPMQPERPMPPMQPEPFPGYPQEPVAPSLVSYPSYGDINSFVQANMGDPRAIADAIGQYGVSASDLAGATGYSNDQINEYFKNAGVDPYGQMRNEQAAMDAAKMAATQTPRPEPVANVLPSDMDFMRQNGII